MKCIVRSIAVLALAHQLVSPVVAQSPRNPQLVVNIGHSGSISSVAISPDSKLVLSGSKDDKVAILWEAATGREIRRFTGHQRSINAVAFSLDGRWGLTGSGNDEAEAEESEETEGATTAAPRATKDNTARLWDLATGNEIRRFEGHEAAVNAVAFSPDGKYILTGSSDQTARLWDAATGREVRKFVGHTEPIQAVAFSPTAPLIATGSGESYGCEDCTARLWNLATAAEVASLKGDRTGIGTVAFSPDGSSLFTGAGPMRSLVGSNEFAEASVRRWEVSSGKELQRFKGYGALGLSPNGQVLATGGSGKKYGGVQLWELATGKESRYVAGPNELPAEKGDQSDDPEVAEEGEATAAVFAPDGSYLVAVWDTVSSGGSDGNSYGEIVMRRIPLQAGAEAVVFGGNKEAVLTARFSTDNPTLQAGDHLWNTETGIPLRVETTKQDLTGIPGIVETMTLSPDGRLFTKTQLDENEENTTVDLWDVESGKKLMNLGACQVISFTRDNRYALCESTSFDEDTVTCWNLRTKRAQWTRDLSNTLSMADMSWHNEERRLSQFMANGTLVALVNENNPMHETAQIEIVATATGRVVRQLPYSGEKFLNTSSDGRYLVLTNGTSPIAKIYDVVSRSVITRPIRPAGGQSQAAAGPDTGISVTAFSPDDKYVATATAAKAGPGATEIWEAATGRRVALIPGLGVKQGPMADETVPGSIAELVFSPDHHLFLTNDQNVVKVWDLGTGKVVSQFQHEKTRIASVGFSADGGLVITGGRDGTTRIWRAQTGDEVCRLVAFANGDWLVTSPDGRFDTNNLESTAGASFVFADQPFRPIAPVTFARDYYEPRLLARLLKGERLPPIRDTAQLNRRLPTVAITAVAPAADGNSLDVTVAVESVMELRGEKGSDSSSSTWEASGAFDLRLFRDGQLVGMSTPKDKLTAYIADAPRLIEETKASGKLIDTPEDRAWREANDLFTLKNDKVKVITLGKIQYTFRNVKIPRDGRTQVEFTAYAFNSDKVKSVTTEPYKFTVPAAIAKAPKKGRAFLLSIGVNASDNPKYNLSYAASDARKMQEIVGARLKADTAKYSDVVQVPLISDYGPDKKPSETTARKAIIKGVFSLLAGHPEEVSPEVLAQIPNRNQLKAVEPEDTVIITYSGHGYTNRSGIFYLVPFDNGIGPNGITTAGLSQLISSDELSLWMQDITATEMIMVIDACHSSAAVQGDNFKPGPMGSRGLGQLAYDKDMKILSATQADNIALEFGTLEQGLLTYALLQDGVLSGLSDADKNKQLLSAEWLSYAEKRVPELYQEVKKGRRKILVNGQAATNLAATRQLEEVTITPSSLNLQQPSLFDFKRRQTATVLFNLP